LPTGLNAWPSYLRAIHRLKLKISRAGELEINARGSGKSFYDVCHLLFTLTSFFKQGHHLDLLHITVDRARTTVAQNSALLRCDGLPACLGVLYQLRRFGRVKELTGEGLPQRDRMTMLSWMQHGPDDRTADVDRSKIIDLEDGNTLTRTYPTKFAAMMTRY